MKIAVPTRENMVDDHFGHCEYYTLFEVDNNKNILKSERLESPQGCGCKSNIASTFKEMGVTLMLAGNIGMGAINKLSEQGVQVIKGCSGSVETLIKDYLNGKVKDVEGICDHHDCHHHGNDEQECSGHDSEHVFQMPGK